MKEENRQVSRENASRLISKPKKVVEEFKDSEGKKVKIYMDKAQAERFDAYQAFSANAGENVTFFFQGLKKSKQQSTEQSDFVLRDYENNHPRR